MRPILATAAVVAAGAAALIAYPLVLRAADETPHDAVERLMPNLMSDDDTLRSDAEKQLFALGQPGRTELERITRDNDPRRAVTALRLLQDKKWAKAKLKSGEEAARREGGNGIADDERISDFDGIRLRLERQMEDLRRQFQDFDRNFEFHLPQLGVTLDALHGRSSGTVVENDRSLSWTTDESGHVKVTVKDGKDAPEETYEAKSLEDLKKDHPEIAERLEKAMPKQEARGFVFRFDPRRFQDREDRDTDVSRERPFATTTQTYLLGIEWSPLSDVLKEQLDVSSGVVVEAVVKGSLAERLGLARNDVLLEVGGRGVNSSADVRAALESVKAGQPVKAVVLRKGQKKTLETTK
jgi:PDZ domain-containing protein